MKREEYGQIGLNDWIVAGDTVSNNIKKMLVDYNSDINNIILNRSSYINAIETIHALTEEGIITYKIDNDLRNGDVLFFIDNKLVGECY